MLSTSNCGCTEHTCNTRSLCYFSWETKCSPRHILCTSPLWQKESIQLIFLSKQNYLKCTKSLAQVHIRFLAYVTVMMWLLPYCELLTLELHIGPSLDIPMTSDGSLPYASCLHTDTESIVFWLSIAEAPTLYLFLYHYNSLFSQRDTDNPNR